MENEVKSNEIFHLSPFCLLVVLIAPFPMSLQVSYLVISLCPFLPSDQYCNWFEQWHLTQDRFLEGAFWCSAKEQIAPKHFRKCSLSFLSSIEYALLCMTTTWIASPTLLIIPWISSYITHKHSCGCTQNKHGISSQVPFYLDELLLLTPNPHREWSVQDSPMVFTSAHTSSQWGW